MELVKVEATSHQSTHNKYMVPSNLLSQVIGCLIEVDNNFLTGKYKRFMKYDDIRLYTLKHMGYVTTQMNKCTILSLSAS